MNTNENQMQLRAFNPDDAETILSWCKDKHAFRLWSADRYKDFPAQPEEMLEQYNGNNMYSLTAVVDNLVIGHILLRYPSEDKTVIRFGFVIVDDSKGAKAMASNCYVSLSIMRNRNWVLRRLLWGCLTITRRPFIVTSR